MRKLVTVKQVTEIRPIEGADVIECAIIGGGWPVVIKKNEFKVGSSGVFFEVDSFLPIDDARFEFLHKNKITWNGKEGIRIRTIKLRGQLSQGLFMPMDQFPEVLDFLVNSYINITELDFAESLRVEKWEPVIPACLAGQVKGAFPSWIRKTDQERCLSGETLIETDCGIKSIREIVETSFSGKVKSFNEEKNIDEFKKIIDWSIMSRQKNGWLKIKTKSGKELIVTNNHPFYMPTLKCYREAANLEIGDYLKL